MHVPPCLLEQSDRQPHFQVHAEMAELSKFAEEIVVEILSRLPPKHLVRFKCVRRSWYALINNPDFAAKHLSVSKRNKLSTSSSSTTILFKRFVRPDLNTDKREIVLSLFNFCNDDYDGDDDKNLDSLVEDVHFPHALGLKCKAKGDKLIHGSTLEISTHCDGIICIADYGQSPNIVLCNPAIKEFKLLPESQLALSSPEFFPTAAVGFGCDLKSKNYNVVRLLDSGQDRNDERTVIHPLKAEVYNLLTDSWKEIKSDSLVKENTIVLPNSNARTRGIYCKGILYWSAFEQDKVLEITDCGDDDALGYIVMKTRIISFDIGDQTFQVINGPYDECNLMGIVLGLWKESIAICERSWTTLDIWVMDDFGGSWTKYLALEPVVKISSQFALFGKSDDQFVLVACDNCVIIFYDICTNKYFNYLPLNGVILNCTQAIEYVSSIISVKQGHNKLDMGAS